MAVPWPRNVRGGCYPQRTKRSQSVSGAGHHAAHPHLPDQRQSRVQSSLDAKSVVERLTQSALKARAQRSAISPRKSINPKSIPCSSSERSPINRLGTPHSQTELPSCSEFFPVSLNDTCSPKSGVRAHVEKHFCSSSSLMRTSSVQPCRAFEQQSASTASLASTCASSAFSASVHSSNCDVGSPRSAQTSAACNSGACPSLNAQELAEKLRKAELALQEKDKRIQEQELLIQALQEQARALRPPSEYATASEIGAVCKKTESLLREMQNFFSSETARNM